MVGKLGNTLKNEEKQTWRKHPAPERTNINNLVMLSGRHNAKAGFQHLLLIRQPIPFP